jgi:TonB family protein
LDEGAPWRIRLAAYIVKRDKTRPSETLLKPVLSRYATPDPAACPAGGGSAIVTALIGTNGTPPPGRGASNLAPPRTKRRGKPDASFEFECGDPPPVTEVFRRGNGVTNPVPIYHPEPQYSEEARKVKRQGAVLLGLVVDANGHPRDIRVIRPVGLGLEEKAIETVTAWRFKPAMKNAQAVAMEAQVEVTFRFL